MMDITEKIFSQMNKCMEQFNFDNEEQMNILLEQENEFWEV